MAGTRAQSPAVPPAEPQSNPPASTPSADNPSQKPGRVTTTVVVHGEVKDDYLSDAGSAASLDDLPVQETPLSVSSITSAVMSDQVSRVLSDVVKNDASVGEDYAPVGYYGDFQIRGFPIDLATGLQINGMTIAGEQDVPLENKESVELLKGIAGVESGVASAGGLIDFVTKRPRLIHAVDLATDHRGTAYGAVDLGRFFGGQKQVGARINLAGEGIQSYLNGADGWRAMGAGTADWKISPAAVLKTDFEYQHKREADGSGYQLLGGTTIPDINRIYRSTMLGQQSWAPPNTFDTFNTGARFDYDLPHAWKAFAAASLSHSLIDDNVIYAYGCYYQAACDASGGTAPSYFFAPDGGYDIYDYRNPGELRIDGNIEAIALGHVKTGAIVHDLAVGGDIFLRNVRMPGYYTVDNPYSPDGVVQNGAVYTFIGSQNIYEPIAPFSPATNAEGVPQQAGPRRLWEDSHQSALLLQDRLHLPGRIQLLASGRYVSLRDHNYSITASNPTTPPTNTDKLVWLPQYAVTFNPTQQLMLYGNYSVLLSLGPQAPFWVDNASQYLAPYFTRQAEIGAKYQPGQRILLSTALFRMRAPFFYPKTLAGPDSFCPNGSAGDQCFESEGRETHDGLEVSAQGKAASWVQLTASAMAIDAISSDTGTPAFDNKQVINVPHVRTTLFADMVVPHLPRLHLMPGWSYTGRKAATRDNAVSVGGYNLFNIGARYMPGGEEGHVSFRLYADNILNKRYWRDTGGQYGDTFIWLGAPPTVRLSAHYAF
ncbi:MAG TPA: TonB-dependent siderophore receptor [Terracidiphilus sp.]|nr:TonB-dependent siderophore receptor [Terracidiphilus sp.]